MTNLDLWNSSERRIVRIGISFPLLREMACVGYKIEHKSIECIKGIPKDAAFLGSYFDGSSMAGYMYFTHPSFDIVDVGACIPDISVEHRYEPLITTGAQTS